MGHADRPLASVDEDSLGLKPYAQGLAHFVRGCDTPFTVAIQGDWGTGKTSLMQMVETLLKADAPGKDSAFVQTVWFQTWQYAQFGSMAALPVSLLSTFLRCLNPDPGKFEQVKEVLSKLAKPAAKAVFRTMNSELDDFGEILAKQSVDSASNADELKRDIKAFVADRCRNEGDRIIVFIDDLDRIKPAIAVEILETIKLFVDVPHCVFVLALDYGVVQRGLVDKFGIDERDLGRSFFDKIIQLPFTVPVERYTVEPYFDALFRAMDLPMGAGDTALFTRLVKASLALNPRGIKRVLNSLQLLIAMNQTHRQRLVIRILFAILCLQIGYPGVYAWLVDRGGSLTADDLNGLDGGGERATGLSEALATIAEDRLDEFAGFVRAFLDAVQDPDGADPAIDAAELARFNDTLTLSRVTSVQRTGVGPADPALRDRNRKAVERLRQMLEVKLEGGGFWTNPARGSAHVCLRRHVSPDKTLTLTLDHGADDVALYLEGRDRALDRHAGALADLFADSERDPERGALLFREAMPVEDDAREALLFGPVLDRYLAAEQLLRERIRR